MRPDKPIYCLLFSTKDNPKYENVINQGQALISIIHRKLGGNAWKVTSLTSVIFETNDAIMIIKDDKSIENMYTSKDDEVIQKLYDKFYKITFESFVSGEAKPILECNDFINIVFDGDAGDIFGHEYFKIYQKYYNYGPDQVIY